MTKEQQNLIDNLPYAWEWLREKQHQIRLEESKKAQKAPKEVLDEPIQADQKLVDTKTT